MEKKLQEAFNEQIKHELYSAHLYLSMAASFAAGNLEGFSHWMKVQVKEETAHAMKIFEFLNDSGSKVLLESIPKPPLKFSSPREVFEETLKHERKITALINKLYELSQKLKDNAASVFLQWFIAEQVEEEKAASSIVEKLKIIKPDSAALLMLDAELGKRE